MSDADELAAEEPIRRVPRLEGERTISPVAGRLVGRGGKAVTLAALVLGCGVFIAATWSGDEKAKADPDPAPARQVVQYEGPRPPSPTLTRAAEDPHAPVLSSSGSLPGPPPSLVERGDGVSPGVADAQKQAALAEASRRAPVIAYSARSAGPGVHAGGDVSEAERGGGLGGTELDQLRRGSVVSEARAGRLPDRNFLILAGANIPCVLQTAMDTSTPGYVTCIVPRDVYSDNGAVVLMEKGTRVLGEYRSSMRQGQKRLFVLWVRAVTPAGVAIDVSSPASDSLGRGGFGGEVDTRFWSRFGGALLLTIVDDGITAAAGGNDRYPNVVQLPSDAAGIALQSSVDIPPTLRKAQGSEVSIFVAQDLNFASVYALQPR